MKNEIGLFDFRQCRPKTRYQGAYPALWDWDSQPKQF
jgi:hypothetical protein